MWRVLCRMKAGHGFWLTCAASYVGLAVFVFSLVSFCAIMVAFNVAFLAYVVFLMVFSFWPHVLWKLVFMGSLAFRLPFANVCRFPARFHSGYYSSGNFLSVLLLSCFLSVHSFQVSLLVCVIFKLVSLACVTFRLFSRSVLPCS